MKILLIRLSALGDVIDTIPALQAVRRRFPDARISWAVEEKAAPLLQKHPDLDELLIFPRFKGGKKPPWWKRLSAYGSFFRDLRRRRFDLALDFHGNLKSGLVSFAAGPPVRVGFARNYTREGNPLFSNRRVIPREDPQHRAVRSLELLRGIGIEPEWSPPKWRFPEERLEGARFLWEQLSGPQGPRILVHVGASPKGEYKRWFPARFARLIDRLEGEGMPVVLLQGPDDWKAVPEVIEHLSRPPRIASGMPLEGAAAFLSQADLVIGSDSGPVHMGSAMGIPTVAVFGPKDPRVYGPIHVPNETIYKGVPCSPCRYTACPHRLCLDLVSVEEVYNAVRRLLSSKNSRIS